MTELDWNALQKEAQSAGVLPDGSYNVKVVESTAVQSSTGKPMIKAKFRVTDGPQKDKPIWTQFVISAESPIALRIFFQQMSAFGLGSDFFGTNPSTDKVADSLMNRIAVVELATRQWQGQDRNEVKAISPAVGGGPIAPGTVVGPPNGGVSAPVSAALPVPPTKPF